MRVLATDHYSRSKRTGGPFLSDLRTDRLLRESDFVVLGASPHGDTCNLIGEKELSTMKKGAVLIQCGPRRNRRYRCLGVEASAQQTDRGCRLRCFVRRRTICFRIIRSGNFPMSSIPLYCRHVSALYGESDKNFH
jgi:hypothetical protein